MKMKLIKNISLTLVAAGMLMTTGCDKLKDFGDTNVDPNRTVFPNTAALLTNVLAGVSGRATQQTPGYYCQYFSETQYPGVSLYTLPQFDFDGVYAGAMYDLQNIINTCNDPIAAAAGAAGNGSYNNQIAIASILKAYYFWTITDAWGDAPYSEALTGGVIKSPKYDTQEQIYNGVLTDLKNAIALFDNGLPVKGDIAYGGDNAKWKKLANSIRLLVALRMSKRYPNNGQLAANEFKAALADPNGVIESNADNFSINFPGGNYRNPWFGTYDNRKDLGEAAPFVTLLTSLNDKRQLNNIYGSSQIGVPYGRDREYMNNTWGATFSADQWSRVLGAAYRADNSRVDIVHASAVWLARAEARERGWTNEALSADAMYANGVKASFTQWGLSEADAAAYLDGTLVAYGTDATENLKKIATQRYIAEYPNGLQGWCEWRRTGVPQLTPAPDAANSSRQIPRRFTYGVNDYSTNRTNVLEAAGRMPGGDSQDSRVWWDQ